MQIRNELYKIKKKFYNKLSILCYHRVENRDADPINITVGTHNFSKQIEWLKKSTNIITPLEFEKILMERKNFPKRSVLLTFDDGYSSYENTMSTLKENSISAVFFISTPKKQFYWDLLLEKMILPKKILDKDFDVFSNILDSLNLNVKIEKSLSTNSLKIIKTWKLPSISYPFERCLAFSCITSMIETQDPFKDNSVYRKLNKINNITKNFDYLLSKPELINYHTIGSHTSNHFNLNSLSPIQQKNQISENKKKLEKYLKRRIRFFAYPYGSRTHYNNHSIELAKKYFKFSFSNFKGNVHKDSNHFEIPRFIVRDWNIDKFKVKLEGFIANK